MENENAILRGWEEYFGTPIDDGTGELYVPAPPPAYTRGFVDGVEHANAKAHSPSTGEVEFSDELMESMEALLMERMFWTAGRKEFDRQGWSYIVEEDTAIRDVNYRGVTLYKTAYEAVQAALVEEIENRRVKRTI